jgi:hypothetical protein
MGEWCSHTPAIFAVPNVASAEPYAHLPQPQQNVATIGGYAARNVQIITAILTNATKWVNEMQTSLMGLDTFT